jgi:hypothetical protein
LLERRVCNIPGTANGIQFKFSRYVEINQKILIETNKLEWDVLHHKPETLKTTDTLNILTDNKVLGIKNEKNNENKFLE